MIGFSTAKTKQRRATMKFEFGIYSLSNVDMFDLIEGCAPAVERAASKTGRQAGRWALVSARAKRVLGAHSEQFGRYQWNFLRGYARISGSDLCGSARSKWSASYHRSRASAMNRCECLGLRVMVARARAGRLVLVIC
jgi:hypothetical protein